MDTLTYTTTDVNSIASVGNQVTQMLNTLGIFIFIFGLISIIAMWKIFTKAKEKGWKSLIPIYNSVILFKIAGLSPWLLLVYLIGFIPFIGPIAILILNIVLANSLSKSFGKGIGFTCGLLLLAPIFYLILAFGNSEYIGNN